MVYIKGNLSMLNKNHTEKMKIMVLCGILTWLFFVTEISKFSTVDMHFIIRC